MSAPPTAQRTRPNYPFEPRSTAYLERGQFWGVPLSDGRFGCGRILGFPGDDVRRQHQPESGTIFFAGLMDWVGESTPTSDSLAGTSRLLANGWAHILAIRRNGGEILGQRDLADDNVVGLHELSHRGGGVVWLYEGPVVVGPASVTDLHRLKVQGTWGFRYITQVAERCLVQAKTLPST